MLNNKIQSCCGVRVSHFLNQFLSINLYRLISVTPQEFLPIDSFVIFFIFFLQCDNDYCCLWNTQNVMCFLLTLFNIMWDCKTQKIDGNRFRAVVL